MKRTSALKRTSISLDSDTLDALAVLAKKWNTSKSEVIRRSVRKSKQDELLKATLSPVEALLWLQKNGITQEQAEAMKEDIKAEREAHKSWWE